MFGHSAEEGRSGEARWRQLYEASRFQQEEFPTFEHFFLDTMRRPPETMWLLDAANKARKQDGRPLVQDVIAEWDRIDRIGKPLTDAEVDALLDRPRRGGVWLTEDDAARIRLGRGTT